MALVIYREGNTHVVRGIHCEATRIEADALKRHLAAGWVVDPTMIAPHIEEESSAHLPEVEPEAAQVSQPQARRGRKPKQR